MSVSVLKMIDLCPTSIKHQGTFDKMGGKVHSWKRRFFTISENALYYYKDSNLGEPLGKIDLIDTTVTDEPVTDEPGFYFMLRFPPKNKNSRTEFLFRTSTSEEREQWTTYIMEANKITVFERPLHNGLKVNPNNLGLPLPIPYFFPAAIKYIEENCLDVEGIYRLNGSSSVIEGLTNKINNNMPVTFSEPHSTTGLIKLYMRTLPEPLLLYSNYQELKKVVLMQDDNQINSISKILRNLPI